MADLECYLCIASAKSGASLNTFACAIGIPLGTCFFCGVFACGHHALRNSSPKGWECVVCVPSHIAPSPGRGGGPTGPTGSGPGGGPSPVSAYALTAYTEEEFEQSYPTSGDLLRREVRKALSDPANIMAEYFGQDYQARVKTAFEITGDFDAAFASRVAAALAVIMYCEIPDVMLVPHLQRRPEAAGAVAVSEVY
jgi:hypothetical protein